MSLSFSLHSHILSLYCQPDEFNYADDVCRRQLLNSPSCIGKDRKTKADEITLYRYCFEQRRRREWSFTSEINH
ncbi:hypothetical protein PROFUN_01906 [Planoprotostelium fungivorum]|uniref:Uncharacterized protein n=1 Tax=Planoprotostelium fungivorum TaxID=1890364 RepID=A0A2P6NZ02_9EUKA|nr:hypothetical protein PROFUN_01906 [Planoprotostelium fungivorum]